MTTKWVILACLLIFSTLHVNSKKKSGIRTRQNRKSKGDVLPEPRLVILGATGVGKSTLANVLVGCNPMEDCLFPVCNGVDSCTKDTSYGVGNWTGSGPVFTVVDTPGFGDSDNDDNELIDEMVDYLKNEVNTTNIFLLSFNGEQDRLDSTLQQMIREVEALFGRKFWSNVVLEFTHWPFDARSVATRNISGKTESWKLETYNTGLREMFDIDLTLPGVFVDSYSQIDFNIDDEDQQVAFQRESSKLWTLLMNFEPFQFMTIEDVLQELYELREEVDHLNRIIEEDIKNLKEDVESLSLDVVNNKGLISRNELKINNVSSEFQMDIQMFMDEISVLDQEIDSLNLLPIGSIVAWSGKELCTQDLPIGWMLCDGSKITEGPMINEFTPALNTEGRFLRGGSEFTAWSYQEQMLPTHQHSINDPGHTHTDAGHTHRYYDIGSIHSKRGDNANDREHSDPYVGVFNDTHTSHADIQPSMTAISVGDPISSLPVGQELRPKNMAVQWIIKIF